MSYAFPKDAKDGDVVTLENGVAYKYDDEKDRWLVLAVAGGGTGEDWGFPLPEDQVAYVKKEGGDEMEGPLTVNDKGINVLITNPNAVDITHPDYDEYSRYPLRVKSPSNYNRFAVRVDDGGGPYSLDEKGKPFQGNHPNYLATIGLLQDKAVKAYPDAVVSMGGLSLSVVGSISDTDDCLYTEAKILSDYSKIVLNHDPLDSGQRVDWLARFPGDSTMFIQQGDQVFTLETTAVTAAGANNRAKHFNIRSHNIPQAGLSAARIDVGQIFNEGSEPYLVGQEEFKASNSHLQTQIDELEQEIDIIAPRLEGAQYKYASSPSVKQGEMFIASNSFTAATDVVFFNDVALDGTTHAWGSLHEGDYLEITDTNQKSRTAENYAMYLCTKEPEGQGLKQIEVALVKGAGAPTVGDVLDAKGFELGGNEINDLDSRYDLKQSHLKEYRSMKVQGKHYSYNNFTQIPAESNCLNMTNTGFKNSCGFIMKDLDAWFPRDKYDFVPGMVTVLEPYVDSGRAWEVTEPVVVWTFWAQEWKEWSPTRQRIQGTTLFGGNAKNSLEYPSSEFGFNYKVNFQCFRRK